MDTFQVKIICSVLYGVQQWGSPLSIRLKSSIDSMLLPTFAAPFLGSEKSGSEISPGDLNSRAYPQSYLESVTQNIRHVLEISQPAVCDAAQADGSGT